LGGDDEDSELESRKLFFFGAAFLGEQEEESLSESSKKLY
jgi:hypothetical protein